MHVIRLLHLSDLHLALKHRWFRRTPVSITCLNAVANIAYELRDEIDGFLITGDIADTGKKEDLAFAKGLLFPQEQEPHMAQRIASRQISSFYVKDKPIILLPGNHDRYNFPSLVPGSKNFDEIFSEQWKGIDTGISFYLLPENKTPRLMIVCADLTLSSWHDCPTKVLYMGQGKVYSDRLRTLANITKKKAKKNGNIPVIWALHFPPDQQVGSNNPIPYWLQLINSEELIRKAEIADVKYIFCGHFHKSSQYNAGIDKTVWIYCAGSSTCLKPKNPPSIHVVEIKLKDNNIDRVRILPLVWNGVTFN